MNLLTIHKMAPVRAIFALFVLSALSLSTYLLVSIQSGYLGFPLDDAWIHQTYARNFGLSGEWAYIPGQPSAGSTSPLWTALLTPAYVFSLNPKVWTFILGGVLLFTVAFVGAFTFRSILPAHPNWAFLAGAFLVFEWHLVWSAASGMETLLLAIVAIFILGWMAKTDRHRARSWLGIGFLIGMSAWIRPDSITLAGPVLFTLVGSVFDHHISWKERVRSSFQQSLLFFLGLLIGFLPYLLFNLLTADAWWPNTFYAKQTEYAVHRTFPLWRRFQDQFFLPLVGGGMLLLPGFLIFAVQASRQRRWSYLSGIFWFLGYLFLFAWRLPVTYQHGRYIIPAMPVFYIFGLAGMAVWLRPNSPKSPRRILSRAWILATILILAAFWLQGALAYSRDVRFIETEMVATAIWLRENTPENALVAAHDIGAIGYFSQKQIVDLAGLISPEVIPFMRDEKRLENFLDEKKVDYLVTFPGWYPQLVQNASLVHLTNSSFAPEIGGENMAVYRWR